MEKLLKKLPFYDSSWFNFSRFLVSHYLEDDCQEQAASLTYITMLSIVPILTVLLMILSSVPALEPVREQIYEMISNNLMPQSTTQVTGYISQFAEKSKNVTAIGAMVLFITTILTLTKIEKAFNKIWRVKEKSGGLKSMMRYWLIITLGPLVMGTAFIASSAVASLSFLNQQVAGYGIDWGFWIRGVSLSFTMAGFIGMYWFIPKAKVPIRSAAIAGVVVTILFELLKTTFGTLITNFTSYQAVYGAFAALPIFLMWIYLSWNLILLGVEISYTLTIFASNEVSKRHPLLSLLDMLNIIYNRHQEGGSVKEKELRDVLGRRELPKWYTYLNYLKNSDLITMTNNDEYVLKKDLSHITLWEFYRTLPYPLPMKDELYSAPKIQGNQTQNSWFNILARRFADTENYAKHQLDMSLADIFYINDPQQQEQRRKPRAGLSDTALSDKAAPLHSNKNNASHDGRHSNTALPNSQKDITTTPLRSSSTRKAGIFSILTNHNKHIITEEDNPNK